MNLDTVKIVPSMMFVPLVFEKYEAFNETLAEEPDNAIYRFDAGDGWL